VNDVLIEPAALRIKISGQWQAIEAKQLALLLLLIKHQGHCVTRDTIIEQLWPNTLVSDNSVSQLVLQLRKTLKDNKSAPKFIKTIPREGYQLIALISEPPSIHEKLIAPRINRPIYWLLSGTVFGACIAMLVSYLNQPSKQVNPFIYDSRLTSAPGLEVYLRYSPNGRYLAFSHLGENQSQFDLAVYDSQSKIVHSIKNSSYSEEAPVWSPDGKWLAYYRFDPFKCEVRAIAVEQTIEMWRLGREQKLFDCELGYGPRKLYWLDNNHIIFNTQKINQQIVEAYELDEQLKKVNQHQYAHIKGEILDVDKTQQYLLLKSDINNQPHLVIQSISDPLLNKKVLFNTNAPLGAFYQQQQFITADNKLVYSDMSKDQSLAMAQNSTLIGDLAVSHNSQSLAHSEGYAQVSVYRLKTNDAHKHLMPISSATRIDVSPTVSQDGNYYAFVSLQPNQNSPSELWVRNKRKANAELAFSLENNDSARLLLFSPDNQYIALMTESNKLMIINLFAKSAVSIANEFEFVRNIYWADDSRALFFTSTGENGQALSWQYSLLETGNTLLPESQNWPPLRERNVTFTHYGEDLKSYLLPKIAPYFEESQLTASFALYLPTLHENGAYFVIREGHNLSLYQYDNRDGQITLLKELGTYLYDINTPLSLSSDKDGAQILINRIDDIEMDIVLHKSIDAM
jgi:DNA-binding winged helix-turn-helix (wHTH) protein/Tol biopolymer transport system component